MLRQHFFYVKILKNVALYYRAILKRRTGYGDSTVY